MLQHFDFFFENCEHLIFASKTQACRPSLVHTLCPDSTVCSTDNLTVILASRGRDRVTSLSVSLSGCPWAEGPFESSIVALSFGEHVCELCMRILV